ncbi:MAG: hypothetical protein ABTQ31_11805 [Rhizobiaceae bacterium]
MTRASDDVAIRRRPDGSIDIDFYARRGAALRMDARRKAWSRWGRAVREAFRHAVRSGFGLRLGAQSPWKST